MSTSATGSVNFPEYFKDNVTVIYPMDVYDASTQTILCNKRIIRFQKSTNNYVLLNSLGECGKHGYIWHAKPCAIVDERRCVIGIDAESVAIKEIEFPMADVGSENPEKEFAAMMYMKSVQSSYEEGRQYVINCFEIGSMIISEDGSEHLDFMVMKYCKDCATLYDFVKLLYPNGLPKKLAVKILSMLAKALKFLDSLDIGHCDISLENIMVNEDLSELYLIDFGMCTLGTRVNCIDSNINVNKLMVPRYHPNAKYFYTAPELWSSSSLLSTYYNDASIVSVGDIDIWAYGIIMGILLTGTPVVRIANPSLCDRFNVISSGKLNELYAKEKKMSKESITLMGGLLQVNPLHRLTIDEVIHHSWFICL